MINKNSYENIIIFLYIIKKDDFFLDFGMFRHSIVF